MKRDQPHLSNKTKIKLFHSLDISPSTQGKNRFFPELTVLSERSLIRIGTDDIHLRNGAEIMGAHAQEIEGATNPLHIR